MSNESWPELERGGAYQSEPETIFLAGLSALCAASGHEIGMATKEAIERDIAALKTARAAKTPMNTLDDRWNGIVLVVEER